MLLLHFGHDTGGGDPIPHGYLAVDFFFMLSGFVIANAYSERMRDLTVLRFFSLRLKRMLPMSMCGVVLGTAFYLIRWHLHPQLSDDLLHLLAASGFNLFLIPKFWTGRASGHAMFPVDLPLWSLLLEIVVNLAWAVWFVFRRTRTLMGTLAVGWVVFVLSIKQFGDASLGWNWTTLVGGLGRVTFGFFAGILIWRFRRLIPVSALAGWWISCAALVATLLVPKGPWFVDVLLVTVVLPMVVYFAAGIPTEKKMAALGVLGDISYPLYTIHVPMIFVLASFYRWNELTAGLHRASWYLFCIPIVLLAYLLDRFYDVPVRRWLAGSSKQKRQSESAALEPESQAASQAAA